MCCERFRVVRSGCKSPTLEKSIAMAYVDRELSEEGTELSVMSGNNVLAGKVVKLPFYKAPKKS